MRPPVYIALCLLVCSCRKDKQGMPNYNYDNGTKSYNESIIEIAGNRVFVNASDGINSFDLAGNDRKFFYSGPGKPVHLLMHDSLMILKNASPGLVFIDGGTPVMSSFAFQGGSLNIGEAALHGNRMLAMDMKATFMDGDMKERGGPLYMFAHDRKQRRFSLTAWFTNQPYSDGFVRYHDSLIYSYDFTSSFNRILFSRFNLNDSMSVIEQNSFSFRRNKDINPSVTLDGDFLYLSDGLQIFICQIQGKFFVVKNTI